MHKVILVLSFGLWFGLSTVLPAAAQWTLSPFLATDTGLPGGPPVVGATIATSRGAIGTRLGFGVDAGFGPARAGAATARVWSADLDGLTYIGGTPRTHDLLPYFVAGFGLRAAVAARAAPPIVTGSYGAGMHVRLNDDFGVGAEARYRAPLAAPASRMQAGLSAGWEYRLSVSFRLGRRPRPRPAPAAPLPAPLPAPAPVLPPVYTPPVEPPLSAHAAAARRMLLTGEDYLAVPYRWGGTNPDTGFDCSGFVQHVYRLNGITLPRVSRDQARAGTPLPVDLDALLPGDLMFFASNGTRIDHVAIYAGDDRILHASKSKGRVGYDDLFSERGGWYRRHFVAARRVIRLGLSAGND